MNFEGRPLRKRSPDKQKHWVSCTQLFSSDVSAAVLFRHGLGEQLRVNKFNLSEIVVS
jgi:hypothetical protein